MRAARAARGAPAGGSTGVAGEHTVNSLRATRLLPPREPLAPARLVAAEADGGRARRASFAVAAPGRRHREIARTCDRWDLVRDSLLKSCRGTFCSACTTQLGLPGPQWRCSTAQKNLVSRSVWAIRPTSSGDMLRRVPSGSFCSSNESRTGC